MKRLKVLIIENGSGLSSLAAKLMAEIFSGFNYPFGAEFFYLKKYLDARESPQEDLIVSGHYDVVVLVGECGVLDIFDVEYNIFNSLKKPISLFISASKYLVERAQTELDFSGCYLVKNQEITGTDSAALIRETLIKSGKISRRVSAKKVFDPVCIFRQTLSEKSVSHLDSVSAILNAEEIPYAVITSRNNQEVVTESFQLSFVKHLILSSDLRFWKTWLRAEVKGLAVPDIIE